MGSVKDLTILEKAGDTKIGRGRFAFSDRYSVFDWGEMPDHLTHKGAALALTTAYFFERLELSGIPSHYLGLVEEGAPKHLGDLKKPSAIMEIKLIRVLHPTVKQADYDYSIYQREKVNFLIPLEIIYRNALPAGSSIFRRLKEQTLKLSDLGWDKIPEPGTVLNKPLLDVSTKLETTDRYLTWIEAQQMAGLNNSETERVKALILAINELIKKEMDRLGLINEDGKIELGFDTGRNLMVVDALGTLDECRFTFNGMPVSKEIARIFYRNTEWYNAVETAKKEDKMGWKKRVKDTPPPLPPSLRQSITHLYCAVANELTGREWFKGTPSLKSILKEIVM